MTLSFATSAETDTARQMAKSVSTIQDMSIEEGLATLADAMRPRIPELTTEIHQRLLRDVPEFWDHADSASMLDASDRSIESALSELVDGLCDGRTPPNEPSHAALEEARLAAQYNADLRALLRTYRVGQAITWDAFMEQALESIADPPTRVAVLRHVAWYQFAWNDRVMAAVTDVYQNEREATFRHRERKTMEVVRDILNGLPVDPRALRYELKQDHVAAVCWGVSPEEVVRDMALSARSDVVTISGPGEVVYAWFGGHTVQKSSLPRFEPSEGNQVALGQPAFGIEGFRTSHQQALSASQVLRLGDNSILVYSDVALEALFVRDLDAVRQFVSFVLGPLFVDANRAAILCETLRAYFDSGLNAASTSHQIGVHERTVAYRLRSIEQKLGIPIASRRDDLSLALRLTDLVGTPASPSDESIDD